METRILRRQASRQGIARALPAARSRPGERRPSLSADCVKLATRWARWACQGVDPADRAPLAARCWPSDAGLSSGPVPITARRRTADSPDGDRWRAWSLARRVCAVLVPAAEEGNDEGDVSDVTAVPEELGAELAFVGGDGGAGEAADVEHPGKDGRAGRAP